MCQRESSRRQGEERQGSGIRCLDSMFMGRERDLREERGIDVNDFREFRKCWNDVVWSSAGGWGSM